MKREYLELKTCRTEKAEFIRGKEYIVLDTTSEYTYEYDFKVLPCYRVVNERGAVEPIAIWANHIGLAGFAKEYFSYLWSDASSK